MNQAPYSVSKPRNSYELVGRRLQGLIASAGTADSVDRGFQARR